MDAISQAILGAAAKSRRERHDDYQILTPQAWLRLTARAARLALSGARFSAEDRAEVAAKILADGCAELGARLGPGATPKGDDPAHGLTAYYRRAGHERARLDKERAQQAQGEQVAEQVEAVADGGAEPALMGGATPLVRGEALDPAQAQAYVREVCADLSIPPTPHVLTTLYGAVRDRDGETVAAELDLTPAYVRKAKSLGLKVLRDRFASEAPPSEHGLTQGTANVIRALVGGEPVEGLDPCEHAPAWLFAVEGRPAPHGVKRGAKRGEAYGAQERRARTGTAGGEAPTRPAELVKLAAEQGRTIGTGTAARDLCEQVRFDPAQVRGGEAPSTEAQLEARATAQVEAMRATLRGRTPRPKRARGPRAYGATFAEAS